MSHSKERTEKDCLNCGTIVEGRYCQVCGQENIVPKDTLWGLISHFFQDITHFDGKFFSTGRLLLTKPGFLPKEYIAGRRARYLHPIRMYVFTSAVFFLIFYSVYNPKNMGFWKGNSVATESLEEVEKEAYSDATNAEDSAEIRRAFALMKDLPIDVKMSIGDKDSTSNKKRKKNARRFFQLNTTYNDAYESRAEYDSIQRAMPPGDRDGWWNRMIEYRNIELSERYGKDEEGKLWADVLDKFMHTFPYLLFISLPLYAVFLKLLYVRKKQFYYVDHALFLIYLYIFTFLYLLVFFGLTALEDRYDSGWLNLLIFLFMLAGIYYTCKAMRKFYGQGRWKTILKFILFNLLSATALIFLFVVFFVYALLRI